MLCESLQKSQNVWKCHELLLFQIYKKLFWKCYCVLFVVGFHGFRLFVCFECVFLSIFLPQLCYLCLWEKKKKRMCRQGGYFFLPDTCCSKGCTDHTMGLGHYHEKTRNCRGGEKIFLRGTRWNCTKFTFVLSFWVEQNEACKWKPASSQ